MKKRNTTSFARKLIICLLATLLLVFCLISVFIYSYSQKFINENAYLQADGISSNTLRTIDRRLIEIEQIPQTIFGLYGNLDPEKTYTFPEKLLISYPSLSGCYIHLDKTNGKIPRISHLHAFRTKQNTIRTEILQSDILPNLNKVYTKRSTRGYWIVRKNDADNSVISYCEPIYDRQQVKFGTLEVCIILKNIIDFIQDIKILNSGFMFLIDDTGKFISQPRQASFHYANIQAYAQIEQIDFGSLGPMFIKGNKNAGYIRQHDQKYYFYFTPLPDMHLRLGIICPYNEIARTSSRFNYLLFSSLGIGCLAMLGIIIIIVQKLSAPLRNFAGNIKKIANGQLPTDLPAISSHDEIKELHDAFVYMQKNVALYLEQLKITTAENEKINTDIKLAQKLQKRFLPKPVSLPSNIELCGEIRQSKSVGGDLYEYFIIGSKLYFAIGDVSGKGIPAALYMASIVKLFRYVASKQVSSAEICNIINSYMCDNIDDDMYVTMFIGIMDINTGVINFTDAGHPTPIILEKNGEITQLNKYPDAPIGILEDYTFSEHTYTLSGGSQILLYTDGITDAESSSAQFYGKERLMKCVQNNLNKNPQDIISDILSDIHNYTDGAEQSDDYTILSILYKGNISE